MKTLKQIIEEYLRDNNLDGLGCENAYECSCFLGDDFMNCDEPSPNCIPGRRVEGDAGDIIAFDI